VPAQAPAARPGGPGPCAAAWPRASLAARRSPASLQTVKASCSSCWPCHGHHARAPPGGSLRAMPHTQTLQLPGGGNHQKRTPSQSSACWSASPSCVPPPKGAGSECVSRSTQARGTSDPSSDGVCVWRTLPSRGDVQGWPAAAPMPSTMSRTRSVSLLSFLLLGSTPVALALDAWPGTLASERPVVPDSQPNVHGETDLRPLLLC